MQDETTSVARNEALLLRTDDTALVACKSENHNSNFSENNSSGIKHNSKLNPSEELVEPAGSAVKDLGTSRAEVEQVELKRTGASIYNRTTCCPIWK